MDNREYRKLNDIREIMHEKNDNINKEREIIKKNNQKFWN